MVIAAGPAPVETCVHPRPSPTALIPLLLAWLLAAPTAGAQPMVLDALPGSEASVSVLGVTETTDVSGTVTMTRSGTVWVLEDLDLVAEPLTLNLISGAFVVDVFDIQVVLPDGVSSLTGEENGAGTAIQFDALACGFCEDFEARLVFNATFGDNPAVVSSEDLGDPHYGGPLDFDLDELAATLETEILFEEQIVIVTPQTLRGVIDLVLPEPDAPLLQAASLVAVLSLVRRERVSRRR